MNTQRPEWNDANNALVGNGVSMVTLNYLNRFINFFENLVEKSATEEVEISSELATFFNTVVATFNQNKNILSGTVSDIDRKTVLDGLGEAGSVFRSTIYENGFSSERSTVTKTALLAFFSITKEYLEQTIIANKRADNLYHAYKLMTIENDTEEVEISSELATFFNTVAATFNQNKNILSGTVSDIDRKTVLDGLGEAGSVYRSTIYENGFSSERSTITKTELLAFFSITKEYLEHTIKANKRSDNLYHAYNLMTIENDTEVSVSYLPEMLEGQVAVLSAGYLSSKEALDVLDGMKASALFREDQYSYILYPNKELARFDEKNVISKTAVAHSKLLTKLISDDNTQVINQDVAGKYHFNANFNNANSLKEAFEELPEAYSDLLEEESKLVLHIFEEVFNHKAFTGRSGTFFGYEGLGSIYWHMVSKLLLAVQENCLIAVQNNESAVVIGKLFDHYYEIQAGIGVHKSPELYGAVPTDPYSHTPGGKGAQQPGMTGQVKEDVLSRIGELGVFVRAGKIIFNPRLLRASEFLKTPKTFEYTAISKEDKTIELIEGSLGFTYCQVPVIYKNTPVQGVKIFYVDGSVKELKDLILDESTSKLVFERTGTVAKIEVSVKK
jgi:hypothetical protein